MYSEGPDLLISTDEYIFPYQKTWRPVRGGASIGEERLIGSLWYINILTQNKP
jgi:hypothetical protein